MRETLRTEIALEALTMAIGQRPALGLIHHSDRGIQYAAEPYRLALARSGIAPSMSRKGEQTHASHALLAKIIVEKKAALWINHDLPTFDSLKHSP